MGKIHFTEGVFEFQTVEMNTPWILLWDEHFIVSYKSYKIIRLNYEVRRRKLYVYYKNWNGH